MTLNEEEVREIDNDLNTTSKHLTALGELLKYTHPSACFSNEAMYRMSDLITEISSVGNSNN